MAAGRGAPVRRIVGIVSGPTRGLGRGTSSSRPRGLISLVFIFRPSGVRSMRPFRYARTPASTRFRVPVFWYTCLRCVRTVSTETPSRSATSRFDSPRPTRRKTSTSRCVSGSITWGPGAVAAGTFVDSPRAVARTAETITSWEARFSKTALAPASNDRKAYSTMSNVVRTKTPVDGPIAETMRLVASMPSSPANCTSVTTTSGLSCSARAQASQPLATSATISMSGSRESMVLRPTRAGTSASAIKTRIWACGSLSSSPVTAHPAPLETFWMWTASSTPWWRGSLETVTAWEGTAPRAGSAIPGGLIP